MKRININTPFNPEIQVPMAIDKARKQEELDNLLSKSDMLAHAYFEAIKNKNSIAFADKQMSKFGLVLFDRGYEVVTYKYSGGVRDFVAQYEN